MYGEEAHKALVAYAMIEPPHSPLHPASSRPGAIRAINPPSQPLVPTKAPITPPRPELHASDASDPAAARWFLPPSSGRIWRDFNSAKFYVGARTAWNDISDDLSLLADPSNDFAYFLGWEMSTDTPIHRTPDIDLVQLLKKASDLSITIRAMLAKLPTNLKQNRDAIDFINSLSNGSGIWDDKNIFAGTHHQKAVIIQRKNNLVAYCGGIDLHPSRENWNDSYCRLEGPSAHDIYRTFVERWQDYVADFKNLSTFVRQRLFGLKRIDLGPPAMQPPLAVIESTRVSAQVVRTYPNGLKHGGVGADPVKIMKPTSHYTRYSQPARGYDFAPRGEHSIYDLIRTALRVTEKFIYIQDQYLFAATSMAAGPSIAELLADKLAENAFKALVILIPRTESISAENFQAWRRRADFISTLKSADPKKLAVCQYRISNGSFCDYNNPPYVHSKSWVFDDRFAIIGSANCNRRGYTHDSELAVGVYDQVERNERLAFAHEFRIAQWLRSLNESIPDVKGPSQKATRNDVLDFLTATHYWFTPSSDSPIVPYDISVSSSPAKNRAPDQPGPAPKLSEDRNWNTLLDPDGS